MTNKIIIAIDGHSSTGKSTLAKMLSSHLKYKHINTGSMYRALTLHAIQNNWIKHSKDQLIINREKIIESINHLMLDFRMDKNNNYHMYMNNENIEDQIKTLEVSKYVSKISTYPLVRKKIVSIQQEIGKSKGVVMEGRDIGSVVFPKAEIKLFITASINVRAERRYQELLHFGIDANFQDVLENLKMRDFTDSHRENSPLVCVDDAILIDNTSLNLNEQFKFVIELIRKKINFL
tara:strand:+ start:279 stop:983 length:705 start_codon:yes stop_codon:yes gene_type:complete